MYHDLKTKLETLSAEIKKATTFLQPEQIKNRIKELEYGMSQPNFWNNQDEARNVSKQLARAKEKLELWENLESDVIDYGALVDIIHPEKDVADWKDLEKKTDELEKRFRKANIELLLHEKFDASNAILSFHAGTGGLDAQDWAEMLMHMYLKYAENHEFKATILETSQGETAGIKSATLTIEGPYAYGYLKNEHGIHRLVRLSPFNAGNTRETSFALVEAMPEIMEDEDIEINKDDLRVDTFRSSGPGGQNVNKTDSAIRITHIPTGIVVQCQNERSQMQNKEQGMKILKGRLLKMKEEERVETLGELKGKHKEMSWGNQIRSYVLHPYTMVKDHRTGYETSQVLSVLEGDLDECIEAALLQRKNLGKNNNA